MASRGQSETKKLKQNLEEQLDRLVAQLSDLEECKSELQEDEYEALKNETLDMLKEFDNTLSKLISGNMTLVDELGSMQLAIQAAISNAFHTPDVIRMFAKKQPGQLRQRLAQLERDAKFNILDCDSFREQKLEVLTALKKLDDPLSPTEVNFLQFYQSSSMREFEELSGETSMDEQFLERTVAQLE